jgi:hypothetical protein
MYRALLVPGVNRLGSESYDGSERLQINSISTSSLKRDTSRVGPRVLPWWVFRFYRRSRAGAGGNRSCRSDVHLHRGEPRGFDGRIVGSLGVVQPGHSRVSRSPHEEDLRITYLSLLGTQRGGRWSVAGCCLNTVSIVAREAMRLKTYWSAVISAGGARVRSQIFFQ